MTETFNSQFWATVEAELRHNRKLTDERGRLAAPHGPDMKAQAFGRWRHLNSTAKPSVFEHRFNSILLAAATDRVAAMKERVAGFSTKARKLADAYGALDNALKKLAACDAAFAPYRELLKLVGLASVASDLVPPAGAFRELASRGEPAVKGWSRRRDYYVAQIVARQDEVAGWPEPTLDDLSTLYVTEDNQTAETRPELAVGE